MFNNVMCKEIIKNTERGRELAVLHPDKQNLAMNELQKLFNNESYLTIWEMHKYFRRGN